MNREEYRLLYELEEHHWWFVGMRKIVGALLDGQFISGPLRILDAGCGTGFNMSWLRRDSEEKRIFGLDLSSDAINYCRQRGEKLLVQGSIADLPFAERSFDLVISLDVLDSFPLEGAARPLADLARLMKEGGLMLVRVPSFQILYSEHDRAVFTAHRYTAGELARELRRQGMVLERITYANAFLFPVAVVWRLLRSFRRGGDPRSDVKPLPKVIRWLNPVLVKTLEVEAAWLRRTRWRLPFGLSVIAVARKLPGAK